MTVRNLNTVGQLSNLLDLNILHFVTGSFEYRAVNRFPFNVLSVALNDDSSSSQENPIANETFVFRKGLLLLTPCNLTIKRDVSSKLKFIAVHFTLRFLMGPDLFDGCNRCLCWHDNRNRRQLIEITQDNDSVRAAGRLKSVMLGLLVRNMGNIDPRRLAASKKYLPVTEYINKHADARTSVRALADFCGLRADVFSRRFTHEMGMTPQKFLHDSLVNRISSLLLTSDLSIKEIADKMRFCSEFYLSTFFKRKTGSSPSEFRHRFSNEFSKGRR